MTGRINQNYSLGGFGERLKVAREALNLSQKDAAVRLHLNSDVLQMLETENFEKAPPTTFLRGYLRSYARLLNFTEEDINAVITQAGLESQTSNLVVPILPTETMQMGDRYVQWISTTVVLGLFIFVGIWWGLHSSSGTNSSNTVARAPAPQASPTVTTPVQTANTATNPPAAAPAPAVTQPVTPTVAQQPPAAPIPPTPANTNTMATTQQPTAPTAMPSANPATPPVPPVAATALPTNTPGAPLMTPIDPALQANTTAANEETPKKHHHHRQDNNVSGFAMALPEPGL